MRNHEFGTQMRGYDKAEVKAFVEGAADALEIAINQFQALKNENEKIIAQYKQLKDLEDTIKSAVMEAQKNANQILANAKKESELMLSDAKQKSEKMYDEKHKHLKDIEDRIQKLEYQKESFYSKLRSEIESHLKLVDSICPKGTEMKSEVVTPNDNENEIGESEEIHAPEKESKPSFDMKDDDINAALDHLSGPSESANTEAPPPEPVGVENQPSENNKQETSEENQGVQDGQSQSKGYDF
jgi:cell division initiation protein